METAKVDHTRGLCGKPDVNKNTPIEKLDGNPAHCKCCGSEMEIRDMNSLGMQQLGMYLLVCKTCP